MLTRTPTRETWRRRLVLLATLLLTSSVTIAASAAGAPKLVYISNLPDIDAGPGLAEAAGLIETLRTNGDTVYLLHGGDSLAPSTLSAFDRGAHMVALLNELQPVAMAVAKREFAFGEDELTLRAYEAAFPMLSNNLFDSATGAGPDGLVDSAQFTVGDRRICITASVSSELQQSYLPERVVTRDPVSSTRAMATELRQSGCDVVIALFGDIDDGQTNLLSSELVDLVISASSNATPEILGSRFRQVIVDAARPTAVIVELGTGNPCVLCKTFFQPLQDVSASEEMSAQMDIYREKLARILDIPVGRTLTALDTRSTEVRSGENAFGNLVADALREAVAADVALMNSGGIRGNRRYLPGAVLTRGDLQSELPFRNRIALLEISGAQLRSALEDGLRGYDDLTGAFPQVSGLRVVFDPEAEVGRRILSVETDDGPIDENRRYSLATVDFLAQGGDGYASLTAGRPLRTSINTLLWETLRSYIDAREDVAPVIEGRLRRVAD